MEKKEVSTQTDVEATTSPTKSIKVQISTSPMKKGGARSECIADDPEANVSTADESSDQQAKKPTAKKKGSFKRSKNADEPIAVECQTADDDGPQAKIESKKSQDCDVSFKRRSNTAEKFGEVYTAKGATTATNDDDDAQAKRAVQKPEDCDDHHEAKEDTVKTEDHHEAKEDTVKTEGGQPDEDHEIQNVNDPTSIRTVIDSNTEDAGWHEHSSGHEETDSCSSLSSSAFHLDSRLEDSSADAHNAVAEPTRLPEAFHTPDCKRHQFLSPDETQALVQLQNEVGKFSFYICGDGRVVIHPEDSTTLANRGLLKHRFLEVVGATTRGFEIIVKDSSFKGKFCTHRIGAKVVADGSQTTAGMYICHRGVLYLVSSAHNFVFSESGYDGSEKKQMLLLDEGRAFMDVAGENVPLRPLYCVFSKMCDLKEKGRRIMHLVDISIALAPLCASHIQSGRAQYCASIGEGQDSCRDCDETVEDCNDSRHRRDCNPCQFKISGFYDFGGPMGCCADSGEDQLRRYYDKKLLYDGGALVRCRPCDSSVVAGRVFSFDNVVMLRIDEQRTVTATNVLLIRPVKRSITPKLGDSGSVWVLDGTSDAVAITVGLGEAPDGGLLWAATPLQPVLEALCCAFPNVFPDVTCIKPACHGGANLSTAPSSEAAAMATLLSATSSTTSLVGHATEGDLGYLTATSNPES